MAKVINRRRKNQVGLQLFGDEYEFLTAKQKSVVNKNLKSTSAQLGSIESAIFEKSIETPAQFREKRKKEKAELAKNMSASVTRSLINARKKSMLY